MRRRAARRFQRRRYFLNNTRLLFHNHRAAGVGDLRACVPDKNGISGVCMSLVNMVGGTQCVGGKG
jgi:hypothetical protein